MNPLHLPGPEFLKLYGVVLAGAVVIAILLRRWLRRPSDEPVELPELSPYDVAYLADSESRALAVALSKLVRSDAIAVDGQERHCRSVGVLPASVHPFEDAVCSAIGPSFQLGASSITAGLPSYSSTGPNAIAVSPERGTPISEIQSAAAAALTQIKQRLEELGLLVASDQKILARCVPTLLVVAVVLLGGIKIWIGTSRDKPVGSLVALTILAGIVAVAGFARPVHRSRRGDRVLTRLQTEYSALETNLRSKQESILAADWDIAIALFGLDLVTSGPLADLAKALRPPSASGGDVGEGFGGVGDGGGCGGGCGGCGGCGG